MQINAEVIAKMNPCRDRFNNFTENYPGFSGTLGDFLSLDKITYLDKIWVGVRLLSPNQRVRFSVACAESVLEIFEKYNPNDKSPRELLEYIKSISDFEKITVRQRERLLELRCAAYAATESTTTTAATAAAYAAAYAAYAAYAAAYAAYAAAYAAYAAAYAAYAARKQQQELNLMLLYQIANEGV